MISSACAGRSFLADENLVRKREASEVVQQRGPLDVGELGLGDAQRHRQFDRERRNAMRVIVRVRVAHAQHRQHRLEASGGVHAVLQQPPQRLFVVNDQYAHDRPIPAEETLKDEAWIFTMSCGGNRQTARHPATRRHRAEATHSFGVRVGVGVGVRPRVRPPWNFIDEYDV